MATAAPPPPLRRPGPRASVQRVDLRVRRLNGTATLPTRAHDGDAGLDLFAAEDAAIAPGERASVGTGVAIEIPAGYAGLVLPRSGLANRHGIALVNAPGLIDSGYRGELRVLLLNTDAADPFEVAAGDRIAQLLVIPLAEVEPVEAAELAVSTRGEAGFGSSGR
jgi:dUTP pyrophosphatase